MYNYSTVPGLICKNTKEYYINYSIKSYHVCNILHNHDFSIIFCLFGDTMDAQ